MAARLPPGFWAFARQHGFPARGPRGSPENEIRRVAMPILRRHWALGRHWEGLTRAVKA